MAALTELVGFLVSIRCIALGRTPVSSIRASTNWSGTGEYGKLPRSSRPGLILLGPLCVDFLGVGKTSDPSRRIESMESDLIP